MGHSQAVERVRVHVDQSAGKLTDYGRLIQEHAFQAVAVEADWRDAHRVDCYVVAVLIEWLRTDNEWAGCGVLEPCENFSAEHNARLVQNAEEDYWSLFRGRISTWNLSDRHMAETLQALAAWLERRSGLSTSVVWEHNSHIGDARATHMGLPGSWESLFHEAGMAEFLPDFRGDPELTAEHAGEQLERAIGVIYRPQTERTSHYCEAEITQQFEAVIHIDKTRAVEPLGCAGSTVGDNCTGSVSIRGVAGMWPRGCDATTPG